MRVGRAMIAGLMTVTALAITLTASAAPIGKHAFWLTWERTDRPVVELHVSRTWMWGQEAHSDPLYEPYIESLGGLRVVQYFDKSRMEITNPLAEPDNLWYVSNGLLARELITGEMQVGENTFETYEPAAINVAGDMHDPDGPTYATFNSLTTYDPLPDGWHIIQTVDREGEIGVNDTLAGYDVTAGPYVVETNHRVASIFWEFMTSTGMVYEDGQYPESALFPNAFYATGFPLTEAYWTTVRVDSVPHLVLVQVFERRVLTYTPDNPSGWQVEAGNVGQHYHTWRYHHLGMEPDPAPIDPPAVPDCVDINRAPLEDLTRIVHISENRAAQFPELRPFTSVDDLERVSGIGPARVEDIRNQGVACVI